MSEARSEAREPVHVEIAALDVIARCAKQSFTENQLMYLADAFAEIAREKRREREES